MTPDIDPKFGEYPLMYEDELPEDMPDDDYDQWFALSRVVDGVRMGPLYSRQSGDGTGKEATL